MKDPTAEEVHEMIEFLIGREGFVNVTHELCMIRRKISIKRELRIGECMFCLNCKDMIADIKHREEKEIERIIFEE
jgi:uncharacterized protein YheU (UPF0270 family)